jgi:hypothetical protein
MARLGPQQDVEAAIAEPAPLMGKLTQAGTQLGIANSTKAGKTSPVSMMKATANQRSASGMTEIIRQTDVGWKGSCELKIGSPSGPSLRPIN